MFVSFLSLATFTSMSSERAFSPTTFRSYSSTPGATKSEPRWSRSSPAAATSAPSSSTAPPPALSPTPAGILHGSGLLSLPFWCHAIHRRPRTRQRLTRQIARATCEEDRNVHPLHRLQLERRTQRRTIYARAAHQPSDLWEVDAGHNQGLRDHRQQYAQHILGFFARTLLSHAEAASHGPFVESPVARAAE
jgi:hypothetical protein